MGHKYKLGKKVVGVFIAVFRAPLQRQKAHEHVVISNACVVHLLPTT
jgi:hypothetical protein